MQHGLAFAESDFKNGDTAATFTKDHGTLEATPLIKTLEVSDAPYEIVIAQIGTEVTIGDKTYHDVFVSRNCTLLMTNGKVSVEQASLFVSADTKTSSWNGEPSYTSAVEGLMLGETTSKAFIVVPQASFDMTKTASKPYAQLEPGTYPQAIAVTAGTQVVNAN